MKSVLISIRPEWCAMIANGIKTIEVRKTRPMIKTPFKCYIYCTIGKTLYKSRVTGLVMCTKHSPEMLAHHTILNKMIIGEFICDRIYPITVEENGPFSEEWGGGYNEEYTSDGWRDALTDVQFDRYLNGRPGYGWHISGMRIYDEPKNLRLFNRPGECDPDECCWCKHYIEEPQYYGHCGRAVNRPPQSWCYVE